MNQSEKQTLNEMLKELQLAQSAFREKLAQSNSLRGITNPAKEIQQKIRKLYPEFYPKLKEIEITQAIELLRSEGYKVLKKVETVEYEEI